MVDTRATTDRVLMALSSDKYGRWEEHFGRDKLAELVTRVIELTAEDMTEAFNETIGEAMLHVEAAESQITELVNEIVDMSTQLSSFAVSAAKVAETYE
jgi:hypothetical protein